MASATGAGDAGINHTLNPPPIPPSDISHVNLPRDQSLPPSSSSALQNRASQSGDHRLSSPSQIPPSITQPELSTTQISSPPVPPNLPQATAVCEFPPLTVSKSPAKSSYAEITKDPFAPRKVLSKMPITYSEVDGSKPLMKELDEMGKINSKLSAAVEEVTLEHCNKREIMKHRAKDVELQKRVFMDFFCNPERLRNQVRELNALVRARQASS